LAIVPFLCERPVVIGNGLLFVSDSELVRSMQRCVVRFNDVNSWRAGDRTDVHVVRHPSSFLTEWNDVPTWHVAVRKDQLPSDATTATSTLVYETQYGLQNEAPSDERIFPRCASCEFCRVNGTLAGPSTGALVLSALEEAASVRQIDVFGMNWNGNREMHVDFADPDLVRRCCSKCVVHDTLSDIYGGHEAIMVYVIRWVLFAFACLAALTCSGYVLLRMRRRRWARLNEVGEVRDRLGGSTK